MPSILRCILAASFLLAAAPASAQWYLGAAAGPSRASFDGSSLSEQLLDLGFESATTSGERRDAMFRLHGGRRLHRHFAVELAYAQSGRVKLRADVAPAGILEATVRSEMIEASVLGLLPLGERLTAFARAGAFSARTRASYSSGGSVALVEDGRRQSERGSQASYGAGLLYGFAPGAALRLEWTRHGKLGGDLTGGKISSTGALLGVQWTVR